MFSHWIKLVTWLVKSNQSALFYSRVVTLAHLNKVCNQCNQIWRNFATLAKCSNSLAILEGIFSTRQNIEDTLVIFLYYWANGHRCKGPNIWQSGHTLCTLCFTFLQCIIVVVYTLNWGRCWLGYSLVSLWNKDMTRPLSSDILLEKFQKIQIKQLFWICFQKMEKCYFRNDQTTY